jgi:PKD repeat protein
MRAAPSGHLGETRFSPGCGYLASAAARLGVWFAIGLVMIAWPGSTSAVPDSPHPSPILGLGAGEVASDPLAFGNWSTLSENVSPPQRGEGTFTWATFGGRQVGVLFGGRGNFSILDNDTWLFENGTWHELNLTVNPGARRGAMAAFDPADGYVVLFGGSNLTTYFNDTWVFNGTAWSELAIAHAPPPRRAGGFAWDAADGYLLLFSGHNGSSISVDANFTPIDDTWTFVHGRWTELFPSVQPAGRSQPSEVYDGVLGAIVVFGGDTTRPTYQGFNDTWTFRGGLWTPVPLSRAPSPRDGAPMAYDPVVGGAVLEGGHSENGDLSTLELNDTWVLVGTTVARLSWDPVNVTAKLLPADSGGMVFDPELGTVVVFGGHNGNTGVVWYNSTAALVFPFSVNGTTNQTGGGAGLSYNFTSSTFGGLGPFSYHWSFGDSATSDLSDTVHAYAKPGNYTVRLNTTDSLGSPSDSEYNLTTYRQLVATLNESAATIYVGSAVKLTVSTHGGTGVLKYAWPELPTGCSAVNASKLTCRPSKAGVHPIEVLVTDSSNASSISYQNLTVLRPNAPTGISTSSSGSQFPTWIFGAGVVVVLALAVVVALWSRNRNAPRAKPPPREWPTDPPDF